MSSIDGGGTTGTLSSSSPAEGAPAQDEEQGPETAATSQQTAVASFKGWGRVSRNADQDEQVDMMVIHEKRLTNMEKFFPEPVWRQVLGKLWKKADIENCSRASPFFEDLLREKVVLREVFGILARRYSDWKSKDESYKETNDESIPWQRPAQSGEPHMMTGLWKCRLVCRKWNAAIEYLHRNEDAGHYRMDQDLSHAENVLLGTKWGKDGFTTESQVVNFLDHFEATHYDEGGRVSKRCPFLGRAVGVGASCLENTEANFNRLMDMFEKFGDQVWYLNLSWWMRGSTVKDESHVDIYLKLKGMVELMPNLKVFRIEYGGIPSLSKQRRPALEAEIRRNPFPELTKLEMISVSEIPVVLCNHLVNRNRQISRLEILGIEFNENCSVFSDKLPNLSQLSLVGRNMLAILESLESYPASLNLEKFHLMYPFPFVAWSCIFNAIGSKINPDICTELVLRLPTATSEFERLSVLQDSFLCRLNLANVERCLVERFDRFSLDFLLESKNHLREIKLKLFGKPCDEDDEEEELRDKQVIKFLGFEDKMELSNIGKELPRLRKLKVYNFRREIIRHYTIESSGVVKVEREEKLF